MPKQKLPLYQIQDFQEQSFTGNYFYFSTFAAHLQEHLFIQEAHKHTFYIVLFVTQGTGTHIIDFEKYEVKTGSVYFMVPGQVHQWSLSADADGFIMFFTQEFYASAYPHLKLYDYPFFNSMLHTPHLVVTQQEAENLKRLYELLQEEHAQQKPLRTTMLSRYLDIILLQLRRIYTATGAEKVGQPHAYALLQKLEQLIDQQYKTHAAVSQYAAQLAVTPKHLNELCKQALGKTSKQLLQERLLLEAKRLLVHSGLTTTQIATELGFDDTTYFFRIFKKQTELTPEQFRLAGK